MIRKRELLALLSHFFTNNELELQFKFEGSLYRLY